MRLILRALASDVLLQPWDAFTPNLCRASHGFEPAGYFGYAGAIGQGITFARGEFIYGEVFLPCMGDVLRRAARRPFA